MAAKLDLLIITQKVNRHDDLLGFFYTWIYKLAGQCEQLTVIALEVGNHDLPDNVKVLSLGKESGRSRLKYIWRFYKYIWQERKNYNQVLVHMNKEYILLGGFLWKLLRKKISLWYVHKQTSFALWIAEKFVTKIFTASKESCNIKSKKIRIIGHGIDIDKFIFHQKENKSDQDFKIIYVGRISVIKNQELLIRAVDTLVNKNNLRNIKVDLVGGTVTDKDVSYINSLKNIVENLHLQNYINFVGSIPNKDINTVYAQADISINLCPTGGVDKAVLESMACGVPAIVLNKSFVDIVSSYQDLLILKNANVEELAERIEQMMKLPLNDIKSIGQDLNQIITERYNLNDLIEEIVKELKI